MSTNLTQNSLMLSNCYESTEVDRRVWLYVLRGISGQPVVTVTKELKYIKTEFYQDVYIIENRI